MSDNPWRAPGREGSAGAGDPGQDPAALPYPSAQAYPPAGPEALTNPYAPTSQPPAPSAPAGQYPPSASYPPPGPYAPSGPYPPSDAATSRPPPHPRAVTDPYGNAFGASDRHRQQVFAGAGYQTPAYRNDRMAVTAMVLGIVGIVVPGVFLFAIAFGHLALHRLRTAYEGGRGLAVAGLAMGYGTAAIWLSILLLVLVAQWTF